MVNYRFALSAAIVALSLGFGSPSNAYVVSSNSGNFAAEADFNVVANQLQVTLKNTSTADVQVPSDVLTALFFNISGTNLSPFSASLGSSTVEHVTSQPAGGNVGGEWAYATGLSGTPGGQTFGISSSGLGLFGSGNFNGPDLAGPPSGAVDGLQYGVASSGDDPSSGNPGTDVPLIKSSVVFLLDLSNINFVADSTTITNVAFIYGTALDEGCLGACGTVPPPPPPPGDIGVPEPASVLFLGLGAIGLGLVRRRRAMAG